MEEGKQEVLWLKDDPTPISLMKKSSSVQNKTYTMIYIKEHEEKVE
jgi:hypothetical protein